MTENNSNLGTWIDDKDSGNYGWLTGKFCPRCGNNLLYVGGEYICQRYTAKGHVHRIKYNLCSWRRLELPK